MLVRSGLYLSSSSNSELAGKMKKDEDEVENDEEWAMGKVRT